MSSATLARVFAIQLRLFLKCIKKLYKDPVSIDGETGPENLIQGKISLQVFLTLRSKIQTEPVRG